MRFGRLERGGAPQPMSEINMTPLIDVMLVLLVIFMLTAPLMGSSLKLDLPRTDAGQPHSTAAFIGVAIGADGGFRWVDEALDDATLRDRVQAAARVDPRLEVQLRADRGVPYGRVAELIGIVQQAGLTRIGFVTEPPPAPTR